MAEKSMLWVKSFFSTIAGGVAAAAVVLLVYAECVEGLNIPCHMHIKEPGALILSTVALLICS